MLVVSEVAVSFLLLIGAGLLINSFLHLRKLDPGYRADHLLTMKVALPETKYPDKTRRSPFYTRTDSPRAALPGVESVAVASNLPLTYNGDSMPIGDRGPSRSAAGPEPRRDSDESSVPATSARWEFRWCRAAISPSRTEPSRCKGRVISEKTARTFLAGEEPIGKRLKPGHRRLGKSVA